MRCAITVDTLLQEIKHAAITLKDLVMMHLSFDSVTKSYIWFDLDISLGGPDALSSAVKYPMNIDAPHMSETNPIRAASRQCTVN